MLKTTQTQHAKGRAASSDAALSDGEWGIREFADMFSVTPRTIRFYEDKGLLSPQRTGQTRTFRRQDYLRFERILRGKRLGFSLDDIGAVFDVLEGRITDADELTRRRNNFQAVIDGLEERRTDLERLAEDMSEIVSVIDEHLSAQPNIENDNVASLADRYQAAIAKHLTAQQGSL